MNANPSPCAPTEETKALLQRLHDYIYTDAVVELGRQVILDCLEKGYILVPWETHGELVKRANPSAWAGLHYRCDSQDAPIWVLNTIARGHGWRAESPNPATLFAAPQSHPWQPPDYHTPRAESTLQALSENRG